MPRVSAQHEQAVRDRIVRAAIEVFAEHGFHRATMQDIVRKSGLSVGAIYTSLRRLELKGYVKSSLAEPTAERGGRSKRYFTLKAAGAAALRQSRERLTRMWEGLDADLRRTRS